MIRNSKILELSKFCILLTVKFDIRGFVVTKSTNDEGQLLLVISLDYDFVFYHKKAPGLSL